MAKFNSFSDIFPEGLSSRDKTLLELAGAQDTNSPKIKKTKIERIKNLLLSLLTRTSSQSIFVLHIA
jgi:hypothetical protein